MPQPRRTTSRSSRSSSSNGGSSRRSADLTAGPPQQPTELELHNRFNILSQLVETIGHRPFSARRLPISDMYEMRTDAVLSFAQMYSKMPLYTTPWWIKCRSAKKAQFYTEAIKLIIGRLISQTTLSWDFGWQSLVKQFRHLDPDWVYVDPEDPSGPPKKVWDEGGEPALVWDTFIPLRPEVVSPRWSAAGRFDGINLESLEGNYSFPTVISYDEQGNRRGRHIPLDWSLWVVNERDAHFGSVWGFSRLAYAYKFWWAYEMALGITTRAVEKKGDPTIEVRYPEGKSKVGDKEEDNQLIAKRIGRAARSGAVLTLPSETLSGVDPDRPGNEPRWKVTTLDLNVEFDKLQSILSYLDVQKIRSMMVMEQAVTEGTGNTSSRNVVKEGGEQTRRMTVFTMDDLADIINRYLIPQLDEQNFPELRDSPATFEYLDLGDQDLELYRIMLQGKTNAEPGEIPIDWREVLERLNMPTLSQDAIAAKSREFEKQAEGNRPPPTEAVPGGPAGVTDTGFYYEIDGLDLAEDRTLLASLPPTKHYSDSAVLAATRLIRKLALDRYKDQYAHFVAYLESGKIELDMEASRRLVCPLCQKKQSAKQHRCKECAHDLSAARRERFALLAQALFEDEDERKKVVDRILGSWDYSTSLSKRVLTGMRKAFSTVFRRAGDLELKRVGLSTDEWNADEKELADWVQKNAASMVKTVDETTRSELRTFLLEQVKHDRPPKEIAKRVREHFADFPGWKADRLARTEVRKIYNAATLFAAKAAGIKQVQAVDGRHGPTDADCEERNGRFFSIEDAFKEDAKEHPRGTLAWRMMKRELEVVRAAFDEMDDFRARFDREGGVVYLRDDLDVRTAGEFLDQVGQRVEHEAVLAA